MARCIGRLLHFGCLTCHTEQSQFCWLYSDPYDQHQNTPFPSTCANSDCADPHITYIPCHQTLAQVRESQRAVVYLLPDGDYMVPESNDPNSELAATARQAGGVRYSFASVQDLREFQRKEMYKQREQWQQAIDEGQYEGTALEPSFQQMQNALYEKARNQVIEYDNKSLREGRDRIRERIAESQAKHVESTKRFKSMRIGRHGDNERYERLRRARDRGSR